MKVGNGLELHKTTEIPGTVCYLGTAETGLMNIQTEPQFPLLWSNDTRFTWLR